MRRHSFFFKLFLGNLLLVGAILALGGMVAYPSFNSTYQRLAQEDEQQTVRLAQTVLEMLWSGHDGRPSESAIANQLRSAFPDATPHVTVIANDAGGTVLGDNRDPIRTLPGHRGPQRPEVAAALDGRLGDSRRGDAFEKENLYLALPVRYQDHVVAAVRVGMPVRPIASNAQFLQQSLLLAALGGGIAAIALGLLVGWLWYAPVRQITRIARQIASGRLNQRARISGSYELSELAAALNEMRDSLARQIHLIDRQRQDLQTVLSNLGEGVVALDGDGRIVLINPAAHGLLATNGQSRTAVGQHMQSVIRIADVVDLYRQAQPGAKTQRRQIELDSGGARRYLDVQAGKWGAEGSEGISGLLVVSDISDLTRAAAMKAEFVANASHELRTPLATLRAAVDSLGDVGLDDPETFAKFHNILDRHLGRLENMTKDLLDLNVVESGKVRLKLEPLGLADLGKWALSHFAIRATEKKVNYAVRVEGEGTLLTDRKLLELIVQNLIDNAIKFTPAGGVVDCAILRRENAVSITVADSGCGIRKEDQGRVFERFFQSDVARSGDTRLRGTGLGLAIAKHAAERLGAKIKLDSEVGKGTTMTVVIRQEQPAPA